MNCPTCERKQLLVNVPRRPCVRCCCKHLGTVGIVHECLAGNSGEIDSVTLLERCIILKNEALLGYPAHLWFAVGGLSLIVQQALNEGKKEEAELLRSYQKQLEEGGADLQDLHPTTGKIRVTRGVANAHMYEATAECPDPRLKEVLKSHWVRQTVPPVTEYIDTLSKELT